MQDATDLQAYNHYAYVRNNPLSLLDPSGFSWIGDIFKSIGNFFSHAFGGIASAFKAMLRNSIFRAVIQIAICAATAASGPGICALAAAGLTLAGGGTPMQAVKAFAFAYVSASVWTEVGQALRADGLATNLLAKGLVHGVVGGALSMAQGGHFMQGFASNAIGADVGLESNAISGGNVILDTAIVGAAGGGASMLTGGKFAAGFITAAFANLFNKFNLWGKTYLNPWDIGNDAHDTLQADREKIPGTWSEAWTDGAGTFFMGRPDLGNTITEELWEIKPNSMQGIGEGLYQVTGYIMTSIGATQYMPGGMSIFPEGTPLTLTGKYGIYTYTLAAPGVIVYDYQTNYSSVSLSFPAYWAWFYLTLPSQGKCGCSVPSH